MLFGAVDRMAWLVGDEAQASPSKVKEIRFFEHAGKMLSLIHIWTKRPTAATIGRATRKSA